MRLIRNTDTTLRQFVLGELREAPRLEIEQRLITEPEVFEALGVVEQELAEAYLEGTLSASEKERFERHYLVTRDHRHQVQVIRLVKAYAASGRRAETVGSSNWGVLTGFMRLRPAWTAAAAAVIALLIGGNLWFVATNYRLQGQIDQVRAQQQQEEQLRQQLQGRVAGLTSRADSLQALVQSQPLRPVLPPTFLLTPGQLRSSGTRARVQVPAGVELVKLQLQLPTDHASPYRAVLYDDNGDDIWSQSKLNAAPVDGGDAVTVALPAQVLGRGDYQVKLSRSSSRGEVIPVGTYAFRVIGN